MIAVHSRWRGGDLTRGEAACWLLSLALARAHFPRVILVADAANAERMSSVGARYDAVHEVLDTLPDSPAWALGKLAAYKHVAENMGPFCHIDGDVFLTKPLPQRVLGAGVFAERLELWDKRIPSWRDGCYDLHLAGKSRRGQPPRAYCAGILGGNDTERIAAYASRALDAAPAWAGVEGTTASVMLEQFALADFEPVETLFPPWPGEAAICEAGYIHLQGHAKRNSTNLRAVERWLAAYDPEAARVVDTMPEAR